MSSNNNKNAQMNFTFFTRSGRPTKQPKRYQPASSKKKTSCKPASSKKKSTKGKTVNTVMKSTPITKLKAPLKPKRVRKVKYGPPTRQNHNAQMLANLFGAINMSQRCNPQNSCTRDRSNNSNNNVNNLSKMFGRSVMV